MDMKDERGKVTKVFYVDMGDVTCYFCQHVQSEPHKISH